MRPSWVMKSTRSKYRRYDVIRPPPSVVWVPSMSSRALAIPGPPRTLPIRQERPGGWFRTRMFPRAREPGQDRIKRSEALGPAAPPAAGRDPSSGLVVSTFLVAITVPGDDRHRVEIGAVAVADAGVAEGEAGRRPGRCDREAEAPPDGVGEAGAVRLLGVDQPAVPPGLEDVVGRAGAGPRGELEGEPVPLTLDRGQVLVDARRARRVELGELPSLEGSTGHVVLYLDAAGPGAVLGPARDRSMEDREAVERDRRQFEAAVGHQLGRRRARDRALDEDPHRHCGDRDHDGHNPPSPGHAFSPSCPHPSAGESSPPSTHASLGKLSISVNYR